MGLCGKKKPGCRQAPLFLLSLVYQGRQAFLCGKEEVDPFAALRDDNQKGNNSATADPFRG
jgi:hypothetical protein